MPLALPASRIKYWSSRLRSVAWYRLTVGSEIRIALSGARPMLSSDAERGTSLTLPSGSRMLSFAVASSAGASGTGMRGRRWRRRNNVDERGPVVGAELSLVWTLLITKGAASQGMSSKR